MLCKNCVESLFAVLNVGGGCGQQGGDVPRFKDLAIERNLDVLEECLIVRDEFAEAISK